MSAPTTAERRLAARAAADGEFRLAARYWDGSLVIDLDGRELAFTIADGRISAGRSGTAMGRDFRLSAPRDVWEKVLAPVPPPFFNDILPASAFGLVIDAEPETVWQYYPAVRRFIDLLREEGV
ncbi:MAG: hypothetical protein ACM3S1_12575 [Hyphomicrobiales bacterium]